MVISFMLTWGIEGCIIVVISNELTILRKHIFKLKQIVEEQETTIKKLRKELSESEQNSSNILLSERNTWVE